MLKKEQSLLVTHGSGDGGPTTWWANILYFRVCPHRRVFEFEMFMGKKNGKLLCNYTSPPKHTYKNALPPLVAYFVIGPQAKSRKITVLSFYNVW